MGEIIENPLFQLLTIDQRSILHSNCSLLEFENEEMVFKRCGMAHFVYYIEEGYLKLISKEGLYDISTCSEFVGLSYIYSEERFNYSAVAAKGTKALQISAKIFRELMLQNTNFAIGIFNEAHKSANKMIQRLLDYRYKNIQAVLAHFFLEYEKENLFTLELTRKEIAEFTGYSRENITHTLKKLLEEDFIANHTYGFEIIDKEKLRNLYKNG
ncbi:helix-turn-helix domain-containing protein [Elizabethkingia argentiflava]|uniref:Helix-turn-helix domain-containing protein n=1 Tax=Elizabethkingia argenteiflava TaxID=2681556 RepID=A0A845PUA7_9FLAO|nr:Crp/Fnr family transcriptional regulator [Elizabethkingia argenteiflava]NAW51235.1 helix-turn-helix domain-containing protein [Elizabethkingia argenteiflava]